MPNQSISGLPPHTSPNTTVARRPKGFAPRLAVDPAAARRVQLCRYRDEMAEWLSRCVWRHYATLTDSYGNSPAGLLRQGQRFVRRLTSKAGCRVDYFLITEGASSGFPHLHALLLGTDSLTVREIQREWRLGLTCVRRYDPTRGAASYVAKELAHADFDPDLWEFSLPPESGEQPRRRSRSRRR
jgi:hypothetical protein